MESKLIMNYQITIHQSLLYYRLRIFSTKTMKPLAILCFHRNTVYSLDFGIENNWLVGASQDNRISLWNIF